MSSEPESHVLALRGACTLRESADMRAALLAALQQDNTVIDCTEVTEVDLSFVQLLLAARNGAGPNRLTVHALPESALAQTLIRGGFRIGADRRVPADPAAWVTRVEAA